MEVLGGMILPHEVKSALFLQPIMDESPATVLVLVNLAHAVVRPTTGTVQQSLVTGGNRAYSGGVTQDTLPALGARLTERSRAVL